MCISEDKLCNSIADCDRAAEELPSFCGNSKDLGCHYITLRVACEN